MSVDLNLIKNNFLNKTKLFLTSPEGQLVLKITCILAITALTIYARNSYGRGYSDGHMDGYNSGEFDGFDRGYEYGSNEYK